MIGGLRRMSKRVSRKNRGAGRRTKRSGRIAGRRKKRGGYQCGARTPYPKRGGGISLVNCEGNNCPK